MIIKIELSNQKHCDDCPLHAYLTEIGHECLLGYWKEISWDKERIARPPQCVEENDGREEEVKTLVLGAKKLWEIWDGDNDDLPGFQDAMWDIYEQIKEMKGV